MYVCSDAHMFLFEGAELCMCLRIMFSLYIHHMYMCVVCVNIQSLYTAQHILFSIKHGIKKSRDRCKG